MNMALAVAAQKGAGHLEVVCALMLFVLLPAFVTGHKLVSKMIE